MHIYEIYTNNHLHLLIELVFKSFTLALNDMKSKDQLYVLIFRRNDAKF